MPISRFVEFAKEVGADGIEILDAFLYEPGTIRDHLPNHKVIESLVADALTATEKHGIAVHAIAMTNDFQFDETPRLVVERNKIRLGIDLAKRLGAPYVRVFSGHPTSSEGVELVRYRTIDALKVLTNDSVGLALENHGTAFATPSRVNSLLSPLNPLRVAPCFDIGNFLLVDADPISAAHELPEPFLVHVKDFREDESGPYKSIKGRHLAGCRLGEGIVPIAETLAILRQNSSHPMILDLELECGEDGVEATRHGVAWLRELIAGS